MPDHLEDSAARELGMLLRLAHVQQRVQVQVVLLQRGLRIDLKVPGYPPWVSSGSPSTALAALRDQARECGTTLLTAVMEQDPAPKPTQATA